MIFTLQNVHSRTEALTITPQSTYERIQLEDLLQQLTEARVKGAVTHSRYGLRNLTVYLPKYAKTNT